MNAPILQFKNMTLLSLMVFALNSFALLPTPKAFGVIPPPDGGYGPPTYGVGNTAEGEDALFSLTSGAFNTATGYRSLRSVTTGRFNTAIGAGALFNNTGDENTATGAGSLVNNTTGKQNTANGESALFFNTTGNFNTAIGARALERNTTGFVNTAIGESALRSNTTGEGNTATGRGALLSNTTGSNNTAIGDGALIMNTSGGSNTAIGENALFFNETGVRNTAIGNLALQGVTGSFNIGLGLSAGTRIAAGNSNIAIGNPGVANESATIRIGADQTKTFIAGIRGTTTGTANAIPVLVDSAGQLGTMSSSKRFKKAIKPMDSTSEALFALKPVSFHYKSDNTNTLQFGLIAEEVAAVNPDLVVRDDEGEIYTVRYDAVNAMLLNEFLKEHRKNEQQRKDFEAAIAQQQKQIEALTAGLQRVSAQLEMSKPAPQVVNNP
jgi:Chaperone of endosialidase